MFYLLIKHSVGSMLGNLINTNGNRLTWALQRKINVLKLKPVKASAKDNLISKKLSTALYVKQDVVN